MKISSNFHQNLVQQMILSHFFKIITTLSKYDSYEFTGYCHCVKSKRNLKKKFWLDL